MASRVYGAIRIERNRRYGLSETVRREGDTENVEPALLRVRNTHGPSYRGRELDTYSVEAVPQATKVRGMQPKGV